MKSMKQRNNKVEKLLNFVNWNLIKQVMLDPSPNEAFQEKFSRYFESVIIPFLRDIELDYRQLMLIGVRLGKPEISYMGFLYSIHKLINSSESEWVGAFHNVVF